MISIHAAIRVRLLARKGLLDFPEKRHSLTDLEASEWSPRFERLMRNRLIMGALRYGKIHQPNKRKLDRVGAIRKRLNQYAITGNTECLVDVANLALIEFEIGTHPRRHWSDMNEDSCYQPTPANGGLSNDK